MCVGNFLHLDHNQALFKPMVTDSLCIYGTLSQEEFTHLALRDVSVNLNKFPYAYMGH